MAARQIIDLPGASSREGSVPQDIGHFLFCSRQRILGRHQPVDGGIYVLTDCLAQSRPIGEQRSVMSDRQVERLDTQL